MSRILQTETNPDDWYKITLYRLIEVSRRAAEQVYALQGAQGPAERICLCHGRASHRKADLTDKESYYDAIVQTIIRVGRAKQFIIALSELIQRLIVDHLHIVGIFMTVARVLTL